MVNKGHTYHHGDLRSALLGEAAAMITEAGVASVTMRAISRRLGVSRTALYRHFPDKSGLLVAVARAGFERLDRRLRSVAADAPRAGLESFRRLGEQYVRFALENPAHYRLMYGKESLSRGDIPELREAADELFAQLVSVIESQQRNGRIKRQNPEMQAYMAWATVHGLSMLLVENQIQAEIDVDKLIRQTTRTLVDGMRARERGRA